MTLGAQVRPLGAERFANIVVLTGAGISAASGLPTFRGAGAATTDWDDGGAAFLSADNLPHGLDDVWAFHDDLRAKVVNAKPNAAHIALADLAARHPGTVTVATMNIDGLHQRAGSPIVHELHGSAWSARCLDDACPSEPIVDRMRVRRSCEECGAPLRPDVVLYGEPVALAAHHATKRALWDAQLFIAVGTSVTVSTVTSLGRLAADVGARRVLVNLTDFDEPPRWFEHERYIGPAEDLLPQLLA